MYANFFKRVIDLVGASVLFVLLLPIWAVLYVLIRTQLGAPVIFSQPRLGKNEKIFDVIKFRSMTK